MMILIMVLSTLLQLIAAYLSIRLVRITGSRSAWILIAAGITVAAVRRVGALFTLVTANTERLPDLTGELLSLLTSVCMVVGIAWIAPLFLTIKRSETSLRESETRLRIVSDNTYDWEYWLSPEGTFNYISPSCERISGYSADEFMADPDLRLRIIHPDDMEGYENHRIRIRELKASEEIEFRIVRANGSICWIGHVCQPVFDGQGNYVGIRGSNRDITWRKRIETTLFESKYYRLLFETSPDSIIVFDMNFNVRTVNQRNLNLLGYERPEDVIGRYVTDLIRPEDMGVALLRRILNTGKLSDAEFSIRRSDGRLLAVNGNAALLRDVEGNPESIIVVARDIMERKQMEEEFRKSREEIEMKMAMRSAELTESYEQLWASADDKEMLLREVHHRVKNDLRIVLSLLSLQVDSITGKLNKGLFMDSIARIKAMALIHQKLYWSQDMSRLDMFDYIMDLTAQMMDTYHTHLESSLKVDVTVRDLPLGKVRACALVVCELVANSLKYAFPDGRKGELSIVFHPTVDGKYLLIVRDDGVGMSEGFDISRAETVGFRLICDLVTRKLQGTVEVEKRKGMAVRIIF